MDVKVKRTSFGEKHTGGELYIDDFLVCATLEDKVREAKVWGETAIPAGRYKVLLRNEGGMTHNYADRYPDHKGMLWLQNVPDYKFVYIHVGNTVKDTHGCILVGKDLIGDRLRNSRAAYEQVYKELSDAILQGEDVWLTID